MAYIAKHTKNLVLVRGTSGSGKSTFAEEFIYPVSLLISTDDFFMINGEYQFNPELLAEIVTNIIVHNTFTQAWEMKPYEDLADKYGYNFYTIIIENRHKSESTHDVPDNVLSNQRDRFEVIL